MRSREYLGTTFEIWNGNESWFWVVLDPLRNRGAIGAAASEDDAERDARAMIDEIAVSAPAPLPGEQEAPFSAATWKALLTGLDRYLSGLCNAAH